MRPNRAERIEVTKGAELRVQSELSGFKNSFLAIVVLVASLSNV